MLLLDEAEQVNVAATFFGGRLGVAQAEKMTEWQAAYVLESRMGKSSRHFARCDAGGEFDLGKRSRTYRVYARDKVRFLGWGGLAEQSYVSCSEEIVGQRCRGRHGSSWFADATHLSEAFFPTWNSGQKRMRNDRIEGRVLEGQMRAVSGDEPVIVARIGRLERVSPLSPCALGSEMHEAFVEVESRECYAFDMRAESEAVFARTAAYIKYAHARRKAQLFDDCLDVSIAERGHPRGGQVCGSLAV